MKPGIYLNMPAAEYHAEAALSNSGMGELIVSPLHFWDSHVNPNRVPVSATPAMRLGSALHAAVLEPDTFLDRWNCAVSKEDFQGGLETVADLKAWLDDRQISYNKSGTKPTLIAAVLRADPTAKILDHEIAAHHASNLARGIDAEHILPKSDWERVNGMAKALLREPALRRILQAGKKEVSYFVVDPPTGVLLKARMDWVAPALTLDPKSFSTCGLPVDRAVNKAIQNGYLRQAVLYTYIRKLAGEGDTDWINAFVESEMPHEVRIRQMGQYTNDVVNDYWARASRQVRRLIDTYAEWMNNRGQNPWFCYQAVEPVTDSDVKVWEEVSA